MRPKVSFLVGSGFSIPAGLRSVADLNARLSKIHESEIFIHTSQIARFLNGQVDNNRWSREDERFFLQEFLEFYNSKILSASDQFHYETFYDFYSAYLIKQENKDSIEVFCTQFNEKYFKGRKDVRDCQNRIDDFNRTYNQLLSSLLHKRTYHNDVSISNYPPYDNFVGFLATILNTNDVKFHTLNHDIFFDWLGKNHVDLWEHFSDGYQLEGSPFYGVVSYDFKGKSENVHKSYYVKLERFVDKFDKALCLFKLHGSVFNNVVYTPGPKQERIRLKFNFGVSRFFIEMMDEESGEYRMQFLWDDVAPDFLSGTTNKSRYYTNDPYYIKLLKYFEENLSTSELLIVIGYGFQDPGINEYLEKSFLSMAKPIIVIDPRKPTWPSLEKYKYTHVAKGITEVTTEEFATLVPGALTAK